MAHTHDHTGPHAMTDEGPHRSQHCKSSCHDGPATKEDQGEGSASCQQPLQAASHIMLAIADDDGSVSLMRLFSHIQPPFEGPEVLPDAMGGGDGGGPDSDEDS